MAVTRIKSNQITDGAVTNAKVADYSIEGGKLANSFTYGSDFTVSGNLTVNGTTTTVDTVTTTIDDPILLLASNQTGNGSVDIGILGERGNDTNVFMGYVEASDEFVMVTTSSSDSNTTIATTDYAPLHIGGLTADDSATFGGTLGVTGDANITSTTSSGSFDSGALQVGGGLGVGENIYAAGLIDAVGSIAAGTTITATGNITGDNLLTGNVTIADSTMTATGTITGDNLVADSTITATGTITGGNLVTGNVTIADSTITASGDVTLSANGADFITFYGNVEAANGKGYFNNVQATTVKNEFGNLALYGGAGSHVKVPTGNSMVIEDLTAGRMVYVTGDGQLSDQANLTFNGAQLGAPSFVASGQVTGATMTASGTINGANFVTFYGNVEAANGNVTGGNFSTWGTTLTGSLTLRPSGTVELNQNVIGNVGTPSASADAATKGYVDGLLSSGFSIKDTANNTQTISQGDTLIFNGTTNEIEVTVGNVDSVTIGLPDDVEITNDLTVGGNLIVQGSQTIVDATSTSIVDPIIQLGRGANNAALIANDGKDRGVAMYYYSGSEKVAYFGWDDPSNEFRFIPEATITEEAVTGSLGTANLGRVLVDNVDIDGNGITTTSGALELTSILNEVNTPAGVSFTVGGNLINSNLTLGRMVYVGPDGLLVDQANLTFNGAQLGTPSLVASGQVTGATMTATGNITGGNITTAGTVTGTGGLSTSGDVNATNVNLIGDVYANNLRGYQGLDVGHFENGNLTISNVGVLTSTAASSSFSGDVTAGNFITAGTVTTGNVTIADSTITATSTITGGSVVASELYSGRMVYVGSGGLLVDQANLTFNGAQLGAPSLVASGQVTGATMTATGTITGGNLVTGNVTIDDATITATGNITGSNLLTAGVLETASIKETASDVVINEDAADLDFRVESTNNANMLYVDAGLDKVGIGGQPLAGGCSFCIETTDAMKLPVGTTAQRPTGAAGMIRYNSSTDQVEGWDVSEEQFKALGVPAFTVIASESFDGDGSTTAFTLGSDQTTQSCIVSINGVVQLPTSAYSVTGNAMTFTEAPESGDKIEVRQLTTTTSVTTLSNGDNSVLIETENTQASVTGNLVVTGSISATGGFSGLDATKIESGTSKVEIPTASGNIEVTGDMIPTIDSDGSTGYSLGSPSAAWKDVYVSSGSLYVNGQKVLQDDSGTIVVSADANQNISIQTSGSGDVELEATGTGSVQVKSNMTITAGEAILSSDGNAVTMTGGVKAGNVQVSGDTITQTVSGRNLELQASGGGIVSVADDLTVTGNLTVNGTTTTVDTQNLVVEDPLIVVAKNVTGTPAYDAGILVERGSSTNTAFIWDESADEWAVTNTSEDGTTAGNVTITSYGNLKVNNLALTGTVGNYLHSNVYVATSSDETNNTGSTHDITAATLGFDITGSSYYQIFLNRLLLRPTEVTANLANGTLTFAANTVAEGDEIEAVVLN